MFNSVYFIFLSGFLAWCTIAEITLKVNPDAKKIVVYLREPIKIQAVGTNKTRLILSHFGIKNDIFPLEKKKRKKIHVKYVRDQTNQLSPDDQI